MAEQIRIEMDAARVCDAIARIGYSPASALMDIVDNSVTAGATKVIIEIETDSEKAYAAKNNVTAYRVIDNGKGMNDEQILNALKLGSKADYRQNSLSKYGMGLKSAGFSLGSRIQIVSKTNGNYSQISYVDKEEIRQTGAYVVSRMEPSEEILGHCVARLSAYESGTVVEITGSREINHYSAKLTIDKLQERLGVVYYEFLRQEENCLSITLRCTGKPEVEVKPFDILFSEIAQEEFDKDHYEGKLPCRVFREEVRLTENEGEAPMILEIMIFPRATMARYPKFTEQEREKIKEYGIKRENKGFFIYRNNRLIRWGDDLDGLVGKDHLGFRARLTVNTKHDDVLHVDVSKQRLNVPEDVQKKIELLTRIPFRQSEEAFEICTEKLRESGKEGEGFNLRNQDLVEEDPEEPLGEENHKSARRRKDKLIIESEQILKDGGEEDEPPQVVAQIPVFEKVRYSEKVASFSVWEAGLHPADGTYVRINKNHSFYKTVLARLNQGDQASQAIEALIWVCAAAENLTYKNLTAVDEETISKVLTKFKKLFATNLDSWCSSNQDLFDND
jgi:hypothetical protein